MSLCNLNDDVLIHIALYLRRRHLSALTRTCWFLHDALLHLLVHGIVALKRSYLPRFHRFMRHGIRRNPSLSPSLRTLRFYSFNERTGCLSFADAAQVFMKVLQLAPQLTSLTINPAEFLFNPIQLRNAVALVPNLEVLMLSTLTPKYQDALVDVVPRLHTVFLDISWARCRGTLPNFEKARTPSTLLFFRTHRESIVDLSLSLVKLTLESPTLTNLRRLSISDLRLVNADRDLGWVAPLIRLFPRLERLILGVLIDPSGTSTHRELSTLDQATWRSINEWHRKAKDWQLEHGTWTNGLQYLRMRSLLDVYQLGPSCSISHLEIPYAGGNIDTCHTVLYDTAARALSYTVSSLAQLEDDFPDLAAAIARCPSLTHLTLYFASKLKLASTVVSPSLLTERVARTNDIHSHGTPSNA
ncbi:hypothetical protein C8Q77DRAFT_602187 [Trametes polyzona]|nr:hypothetical protein C8Q77DRAFT_602187 [Trametes polyzona]